jgi:hypothetical protein
MTRILRLLKNAFRKPLLPSRDVYAAVDHFHGAKNIPSRFEPIKVFGLNERVIVLHRGIAMIRRISTR